MSTVLQVLEQFLTDWLATETTHYVGYSGGRDSHVLVHALATLHKKHPKLRFMAIYANHGLHPDATKWANHCREISSALSLPFKALNLKLDCQKGESLEAEARTQRYGAFAALLGPGQSLMTAHTQDDQAETFLLQALRGAGPRGLSGIAEKRPLGEGLLLRPLLSVSRQDIAAYAEQHRLKHIEDPSNANTQFRRNFIRHDVLPTLKKAYPGAIQCLARSSELCAASETEISTQVSANYRLCQGTEKNQLLCEPLRRLSSQQQIQVLRYWLLQNNQQLPALKHMHILLDNVLGAKEDARPLLKLPQLQVARFKKTLVLLAPDTSGLSEPNASEWDLNEPLVAASKQWRAKRVLGRGIACHKLEKESLTVRYRQGGERCRLPKRPTRPLKKILQDFAIPPWERERLPLFYHKTQLVGMGDLFVCAGYEVTEPEVAGWVIEAELT